MFGSKFRFQLDSVPTTGRNFSGILNLEITNTSVEVPNTSIASAVATISQLKPPPNPTNVRRKRKRGKERNPALKEYRQRILGITTEQTAEQHIGESPPSVEPSLLRPAPHQHELPTPMELCTTGIGQISKNHSFRQESAFETILLCLLKSSMLCRNSDIALRGTHPLIDHLAKMLTTLKHHDFMCLRQYNKNWAAQQEIPQERVINFLACLLHYDGRVGDVIRFASNNYTAEHRNIPERIKMLEGLVDPDLLARYIRVTTMGAPTKFNAETTRDNAMLYLSRGNNSSINKKSIRCSRQ
jgi:hypothetical protein